MSWDCTQLELRLTDYLEGQLPAPELAQADTHARACPRCREHFLARQATGWLRGLEWQDSPPGLETRILAQTISPVPRASLAEAFRSAWQVFRQPRVALSAAATVLSLALLFQMVGVSPADLELADLNPANIYRGMKRQAHLTYARGSRFVNDLWLVYEIRTRLEEMTPEGEPPAPPQERERSSPDADNDREKQNQYEVLHSYQVLAGGHLVLARPHFGPGDWR